MRPILRVLQKNKEEILSGVYTLILEDKVKFFADCTINLNPTAEELARIALSAVNLAKSYTKEPLRVAMLSFSSFDKQLGNLHLHCQVKLLLPWSASEGILVEGGAPLRLPFSKKKSVVSFPFDEKLGLY